MVKLSFYINNYKTPKATKVKPVVVQQANTTVAFSALGGTAFYGCRVGNDELGSIYLNGLNDAGIQTTTQSISEGVTGTCMVLISP